MLSPFFALIVSTALLGADAAENPRDGDPITPTDNVQLFNGRDLSGLDTWLKDTGRQDPSGVFTVHDGMIHISGEGRGYVATERAYRDYHLTVEYRWGQRTDGGKDVRNSGVLLHGVGPDGAASGVWMTSIECQLAQGCEGDLIVIRGKDAPGELFPATLTSETVRGADGRTRWRRGGERTVYSGKQFWWSQHDPEFKELLDTRGRWDVASPRDEWTRVECICQGQRITIKINGTTVNECFDVHPASGKILLQNEGHEVFFRRFELRPIAKADLENGRPEK
ncbi:MAG: DUF1080 domain-containing protein [Planctomycetes bacterium]|nr:DUF1080 domain-containing protein [Planctomycetota bacterium]